MGNGSFERDGYHINPDGAVLQSVPPDVSIGQIDQPPLLLLVDCFHRVAVGSAAAGPHLNEDNRPAIEGNNINIAPQHPFASADDSISQPFQIAGCLVLTPLAEFSPSGHLAAPSKQTLWNGHHRYFSSR